MKRNILFLSLVLSIVVTQYQHVSAYVAQSQELKTLEQKIDGYIKDKKIIPLTEFDNFMDKMPLAASVKKLLDNLAFQGGDNSAVITKGPSDLGDNFAVHGKIIFPEAGKNTQELVDATVIVSKAGAKEKNFTLEIMVPSNWKFSLWYPELKSLDSFEFDSHKTDAQLLPPRFILSTVGYQDETLKADIKTGTTFISGFGLGGPLNALKLNNKSGKDSGTLNLNNLITTMKSNKGKLDKGLKPETRYDARGLRFIANISPEIVNSSFILQVPIEYTIDFTKKEKKPLVNQLKLSDVEIELQPLQGLEATISLGAQLVLPTQKDPLELRAGIAAAPDGVALDLQMDGKYYPAFGLKDLGFGDFGIKLGFPLNDVELRGALILGEKKESSEFNFAGKYEFEAAAPPGQEISVALVADLDRFSLAKTVKILGDMAGKTLNITAIPNLLLKELKVYYVPFPTDIAGKSYPAGLSFDAYAYLYGTKFGLAYNLDPAQESIEGKASFKDLEVKVGSVDFFDLKNISGDLKIIASDPEKSYFKAEGDFSLPFLGVKDKVNFSVNNTGFKAYAMTKIGKLFNADLGIDISFESFDKTGIHFNLQSDFGDYIRTNILKEIDKFKANAQQDIEDLAGKISNAAAEEKIMDKAKLAGYNKNVQKQIDKTNATIKKIKQEIAEETKACNAVDPIERPFNRHCYDEAAQKTALAFQEGLVKDFYLKFGSQVVGGALKFTGNLEQALADIGKDIASWQALKKTEEAIVDAIGDVGQAIIKGATAFQLKEASGSFTGADLEKLATPKIDKLVIELPIAGKQKTIILRDLQFSLTDLGKFIENIAENLIDEIKKELAK